MEINKRMKNAALFLGGFVCCLMIIGILGGTGTKSYAGSNSYAFLKASYPIYVNGVEKKVAAYNYEGNTYLKIRDLKDNLNNLSIEWSDADKAVYIGERTGLGILEYQGKKCIELSFLSDRYETKYWNVVPYKYWKMSGGYRMLREGGNSECVYLSPIFTVPTYEGCLYNDYDVVNEQLLQLMHMCYENEKSIQETPGYNHSQYIENFWPNPGVTNSQSSPPISGIPASSPIVKDLDMDNDKLLDICTGFDLIRYDGPNFDQKTIKKASDISPTGMYIYVVNTDKNLEQFYDKTEHKYKIPVTYVQDYINEHFENYMFDPGKIYYHVYDSKAKTLVTESLPSPDTGFPEILDKEAAGPDTIKISVKYYDRYEDQESNNVLYTETITLKISGNDYKFVSSTITK